METVSNYLQKYDLLFWDFDGVIKDSLEVKGNAFYNLFLNFGSNIALKILDHHNLNGGISRFKKIPLYMKWCGLNLSTASVDHYCTAFSSLVTSAVIDSPWVPGILPFLKSNKYNQEFILITATPEQEILFILEKLSILECFSIVYGAPHEKTEAIAETLDNRPSTALNTAMIGDSYSDLLAAKNNSIDFYLRQTNFNYHLKANPYISASFSDFV